MKYGLHLGYWGATPPPTDQLGQLIAALDQPTSPITSLWTAEAYGSDAFTPLTWWAARTSRLGLGTGIAQIAARTPAATAMTAQTLDHLSGGRLRLGLGVSGPQVVQGWHGQPFDKPLARMREYVDILRLIWAREAPLEYQGTHFQLPRPGPSTKALRSTVHPLRSHIPILLAAQGPRNIELAAEIADGWLPAFFSVSGDAEAREHLAAGFSRRTTSGGADATGEHNVAPDNFDVCVSMPLALAMVRDGVSEAEAVQEAADVLRPQFALYIAGMGSAKANFHRAAIERAGFGEICEEVVAHYHGGDRRRAAAVIPLELLQEFALVGTPQMVAKQAAAWEKTCATELLLQPALPAQSGHVSPEALAGFGQELLRLLVLLAQPNR